MVATSKMRRAQDRMRLARPYAEKIRSVIGNLTQANPDYRSPFLQERNEVKNVGIIVISSDRGLAGSLNINIFKAALIAMRDWQAKGAQISMCLIGGKASAFFRRLPNPILANTQGLGDQPHIKDLIGTVKVMLDAYKEGKIDRLLLVHSRFVNTMTQKPEVLQLLPVEPIEGAELQDHWDYIYEPDAVGDPRRPAHALHRIAGLSRRRRKRRLRNGRAHGRHEGGLGQRRQAHRRAPAHLQQGPPGRDHQGIGGDRRWRGSRLNRQAEELVRG